jgi:iron complex outermembrane recepter protein
MFKRTKVSAGVMLVLGSAMSLPVFSQPLDSAQRVEITGSSIRRADAETALPVTTITREDIARTGATTTQELVAQIPQVFGGLVTANNIGSTGNASAAALRGLPSKYTLVLLNGRRIANYAFGNSPVDLNSIPVSAVERVEVLRDGASAIYGADAVAGVINFILRKDYKGMEGAVYTEAAQQGGGESKYITLTGGIGDMATDGYNVMVTAIGNKVDVLKAKDRPFAASAVVPSLGINKASPRNGVPNINFVDTLGNGYGSKGNGVGPLVNPYRYNGCDNAEFALVVRDASTCGTDYVKYIDLIPEQEHNSIFARGSLALNKDNQLYGEAMYVKNELTSTYSPAPYTLTMSYPANGRFYPKTITLPKGMTVNAGFKYPDGRIAAGKETLAADTVVTPTGAITGTWRTVAGGGRTDLTEDETQRYLIGLKGTMWGWDYDTAITSTQTQGTISFGPGKFGYAKLTPLVASGAINVFGSQDATSQAALDSALLTGPQQSATSKATEFDFTASRDVYQLPAGPLGVAWGVQYRKESLEQISYPVLASGDEVGGAGPIPGVTGDRTVLGLFGEAAIPIVKGLDATLAVRYDDYKNGFGTSFSNWSPKATLRFQPMKELVTRASWGQGYRAPTLYENLRPLSVGNNTNGNYSDPIRCPGGVPINNTVDTSTECNVQLGAALDEGNKNLKPEKSTQWSLGLVFSPMANLTASVDYWDLSVEDTILRKSEIQVMSNPTQYKDFIYRYNPAAFPGGYDNTPGNGTTVVGGSTNPAWPMAYVYLPYDNQGNFKAAGFDFSVNWQQNLQSAGMFGVNYNSTLYTKHGYQYPNTDYVSDLGKYKDFGPTPKYRHQLTFSLTGQSWFGSLTNNYTQAYEDFTNPDAVDGTTYPETRTVAKYSLWDGQVGWRGIKNLDVVFGIKNLLDTDPPASRTEQNFQTGYDAQFTNPMGRTYYLRLKYRFF